MTAMTLTLNYGYGCIVHLGQLSASIYDGAPWAGDGYPSHQMFADELELLLSFAESEGVLAMYRKELRGRASQRDSALEELRVANVLHDRGFGVTKWRPVGQAPKEGEFLVRGSDGVDIFVEVKSPGWEMELTEEERLAGRLMQPKYMNTEAFFGNSGAGVRFAVAKAHSKFHPDPANLLVVADDMKFPLGVESSFWARDSLYWEGGKFTDSRYENLGGVGFVVKQQQNGRAWAEMKLFLNSHTRVPLPALFVQAFGGCVLQ